VISFGFEERLMLACKEQAKMNRPVDAVFVHPAYAKACGIKEHTVFDGVEVVFDFNVAGRDLHPFEKGLFPTGDCLHKPRPMCAACMFGMHDSDE
jgi:hypothetical protein